MADAADLRFALIQVDAAVVVGPSCGRTVIAEAGHHPAVKKPPYVTSYLPQVGQSQGTIMSDESDLVRAKLGGGGLLELEGEDVSSFGRRFLQDADAAIQSRAWDRVTMQSTAAFATPVSCAGWHGVDSTYIVCQKDRSTSVVLQRVDAARAQRFVELAPGHHPFVPRPDLVVDQLELLL